MSPIIASPKASAYGLFRPPVSGSFFALETITVSSNTQIITFGSGGTIPQTYKHLQIRGMFRSTTSSTTDLNILAAFNGDYATGNAHYGYNYIYGYGNNIAVAAGFSQWNADYQIPFRGTAGASNSNYFGTGIWDIYDYTNTGNYKFGQSLTGHEQTSDSSPNSFIFQFATAWKNNNAITSISLFASTSSSANQLAPGTTFTLYGIKG